MRRSTLAVVLFAVLILGFVGGWFVGFQHGYAEGMSNWMPKPPGSGPEPIIIR